MAPFASLRSEHSSPSASGIIIKTEGLIAAPCPAGLLVHRFTIAFELGRLFLVGLTVVSLQIAVPASHGFLEGDVPRSATIRDDIEQTMYRLLLVWDWHVQVLPQRDSDPLTRFQWSHENLDLVARRHGLVCYGSKGL
ncbi:hypothetical protein J2Z84_000939 [Agrobacterium rubi]|nr:hypothetical protein [Agrobacterium rubi]